MSKKYDLNKKRIEKFHAEIDLNLISLYRYDEDIRYCAYNHAKEREIIDVIEIPTDQSQEEFDRQFLKQEQQKLQTEQKPKFNFTLSEILKLCEDIIYYLGDKSIAIFKTVFFTLVPILILPIFTFINISVNQIITLSTNILQTPKTTINKLILVKKDIVLIYQKTRHLAKEQKNIFIKSVWLYFVRSFKIHRNFWSIMFNWSFPIILLLIIIPMLIPSNTQVYALAVYYNDSSIGYVENEEVFEQAQSTALSMFDESASEDLISQPNYELTIVNLNELSSSSMISDNIIQNSTQDYYLACGIYIDGEFLCATKNESDATSVLASILNSYEASLGDDATIGFVEEIEFVQKYYPVDSDLIWDSLTLKNTLSSPKTQDEFYTVQQDDTLSSISKSSGVSSDELQSLNPDVDFDNLQIGTQIYTQKQTSYLRIKEMITQTSTQIIEYETIEQDSSTLYEGTTKTSQSGENGECLVTELITYIDGVQVYSAEISRTVVTEAVDEIILVGTKENATVSSSSSTTGFIWPAIGAYTVSSGYGYRTLSGSYDLHKGVDIVLSTGYSTGTPIIASAAGTVTSVVYGTTGYGYCVIIDHGNGIQTRYAHMLEGSVLVSVGQYVEQGQQIGQIGSSGDVTGPHLHFEVILNGTTVDPLNYISY